MSLWSEIRQRRITQVVFAYLAGGWMVLAVIDQVVDREVLPPVVYQAALTLYLVGILAALVVGWYHGEQGRQTAPIQEIVLLVLIGAGALGAAGVVVRNGLDEVRLGDVVTDDLRSIAVLYFEDLSRDGSMQAVADGISESLITSLASINELDVASRNAAAQARALGDLSPDSIANLLGVGAVIDGSVDQSGDELRVSVRLLEGSSGSPLFRENFTWPAEDVASVGSALATEVANLLREQLGQEIRLRESEAAAPNSTGWLHVARAERFLKAAAAAVQRQDVDGIVAGLDGAEAELVQAQSAAPDWAEPRVLQAQVAYEWYILAGSVDELVESMDQAIQHANEALALEPDNAAALEWRGTATYRKWLTLIQVGEAEERLDALLAAARADLERSETIDRDRASANSTLSHLYYQLDDPFGAARAAETAYEQDAFLDVADEVLWRLYTVAYDFGEEPTARRWCSEGARRFPEDFRFKQCELFLMTMPGAEPNADRAWAIHADMVPLLTERRDFFDAQGRAVVAGVLGRAGMLDSADVVFEEARLGADLDPDREILAIEGAMRSLMGDVEGALSALERWTLVNPDQGVGEHWWWDNLAGNPAFQRLRAQH